MKKFAIILAIVALSMYVSADATTKQGFSACSRPQGHCRSRRKAFMQCVPQKCLMGLGQCMGKLQQKCWETEQECMSTVDMSQCHNNRHTCEQKLGGNQCDQEMQTCMQGKNTRKCDDGFTTCMTAAQNKGGKDCQSEMGHCVNQVPGYKACNGAMTQCYNQATKQQKPDWQKCSNDFQQCYSQLDQSKLGNCEQNLQNCERSSPVGACHDQQHQCLMNAGVNECDEANRQCHEGLNRDSCDNDFQQCAARQGETKCSTERDACRNSIDTSACMTAAQGCASEKEGADKCLLSMIQMKTLEHNPSEAIKKCMDEAGVTNNDPEHTGSACKLGQCVVPQFAAPEAQCWMNCHFTSNCGCTGFVDPTSGCAANNAATPGRMFVTDNQEDAFLSYFA